MPAADGVKKDRFVEILDAIDNEFNIVGICMLGYTEMPDGRDPALAKLVELGTKK